MINSEDDQIDDGLKWLFAKDDSIQKPVVRTSCITEEEAKKKRSPKKISLCIYLESLQLPI